MYRISVWVYALVLLACSVVPMAAQQPAAASATVAVPPMVNFSGVLTGVNGKPLTGTVGVTFYLYQESQGGAPLWMETQNVQPDKLGHYSVALGSTNSQGLPASVFASGEARWLGVQVHGQDEQPRVLLMSVPYAMKALDAETIGGRPASSFMLAPTANSKAPVLPPGTITGSGTADFVPVFTGTTTIGNSKIFETVGGDIGIGTTTPVATLDLKGTGDVRDTLTLFPKSTHPSLSVHGTAFEVSHTGLVTFISGQTFPGTGTVTSVGSGAGLTGGPITTSGTLSIKTGGVTNAMLAHSSLTVTANSPLTGGGAVSLGGSTSLGLESCGTGQILKWNGSSWACAADNNSGGTVTSITAGTGLSGGTITTSGTISVNASVVPELAAANSFTNNNGISVNDSSPSLSLSNAGSGDGIDISVATGNFGVLVSGSSFEPIRATGGEFPLAAFDGSGEEAVYAANANDNSFNAGVYGTEEGDTQETLGVWGYTASGAGFGVYGERVSASSSATLFAGTSGVWGDSSGGNGVSGSSDQQYGVVGVTADTSGEGYAGGIFINDSTSAGLPTLYAYDPNTGALCTATTSGSFSCNGALGVAVDVGPSKVGLSAIEGPESWFEDAGTARLSKGEAVVSLEPIFGQTVNTDIDYHVFLTPNGDCKGLYVEQKSAASFVVRELGGGTSNIAFDYRIMAKRKGYEQIRLADQTKLFHPAGIASAFKPKGKPSPDQVRQKAQQEAQRPAIAKVSKPVIKH
ncbi:MAG TPA: hypothetical protein VN950_23790 [Terriglobales bacterium]|nr:hypothetical protein [Terriglobales bacterium]